MDERAFFPKGLPSVAGCLLARRAGNWFAYHFVVWRTFWWVIHCVHYACYGIRTCIHYFHRHLLCPKNVATALKMLARCPTLLRFLPCIRAFISSNLPMEIVNTGSNISACLPILIHQRIRINRPRRQIHAIMQM